MTEHDKHKIKNPHHQGREGVTIIGGGVVKGVKRESKNEGGSLETEIEIGMDQNDRDETGRRRFL
jgi:hypothetical protein